MKLLMLMRDAVPPVRVDVRVLFGSALRERGVHTDFGGPSPAEGSPGMASLGGGVKAFDVGARHHPLFAWRLARLAWREARAHDVVVARDLPLAAAGIAGAATWRRRPFVYWMSFPMPLGDRLAGRHHRAHGRPWRGLLVSLRGALAKWVQDHVVLRAAAHVFVQSATMRADLLRRLPWLPARRVTAVPMGIDPAAVPSVQDAEALPGTVPRLVYLGSLDVARGLECLIEALALLQARGVGARLELIGPAPREADLQALRDAARRHGVAGFVHFTGALPMAEAWERVARADVALAAVPPGPLHDVSSPTKVVEYLALGVPVVASLIPDQQALLAACGGGQCVPHRPEDYAQAIQRLLSDGDAARAAARRARTRVLALRGYPVLAHEVAQVLRALHPAGAPAGDGETGAPVVELSTAADARRSQAGGSA